MAKGVADEFTELVFGIGASSNVMVHFEVSLHTAEPKDGPHDHEVSYGGYKRQLVERSPLGWNRVAGPSSDEQEGVVFCNAADISFPHINSGSCLITHYGISAGGHLLFSGALQGALALSVGSTPFFRQSALEVSIEGDHVEAAVNAAATCVADPAEVDRLGEEIARLGRER